MNFFMGVYEFFLDILFPLDPDVVRLEAMTSGGLTTCARRLDVGREIPESIILFEYKDPLIRTAIREVKFRGNKKIARLLGESVRDVLVAELGDLKAFKNFRDPLLVPIPMTKRTLRTRGWDQCHLLLAEIQGDADGIGVEVRLDAMRKIRDTEDQVGKDRKGRLENLHGCLKADEGIVRGRNVIVFDDVVTTGATYEEAKRALRSAGARRVLLLSIAH